MTFATALITTRQPDLSYKTRRDLEAQFITGGDGGTALPGWSEAGKVLVRYPHGTLFRAEAEALDELVADVRLALEWQVRVYPDDEGADVRVGPYTVGPDASEMVDPWIQQASAPIGAAANVADGMRALTITDEPWRDWVLQLWAPPNPEEIRAAEAHGVEVVGTVGRFGLHLRGSRDAVQAAADHEAARWVAPLHPYVRVQLELLALDQSAGIIDRAAIHVDPPEAREELLVALAKRGITQPVIAGPQRGLLLVQLPVRDLLEVARLPGVGFIQYAPRTPQAESEREAQIVAGNLERDPQVRTKPARVVAGYRRWLSRVGLSGAGATVAICDTGVAWNSGNARQSLPDLDRRQVAAFDYTNGEVRSDTWGHGTHIAGLAIGAGLGGTVPGDDGEPILMGLGVAPGAWYVSQNAIAEPLDPANCPWWPPPSLLPYTRDAARAGATILTMAWTTDGWAVGQGYVPLAAELDALVRDPAGTGAPGSDLVVVASAGNVLNAGRSTITPPKEAKNIVVVGASTNTAAHMSGSDVPLESGADGVAPFSARGPALDGRVRPTVVAPGIDVLSTLSKTAEDPALLDAARDARGKFTEDPEDEAAFAYLDGTSMAAALVAGACAVVDEWWRSWAGPGAPGAALTRALLVIGADDMSRHLDPASLLDAVRPGPVPDPAQGWGRVDLGNIVLQAPRNPATVEAERRRGPKRVVRGAFHYGDDGWAGRYARARADLPVRVTLAWTDAPATPGKTPALCNDLDLEVVALPVRSLSWSGNRFEHGWSTPGHAPDTLDNLECVYLPEPPDELLVRVDPAALTVDARPPFSFHTPWQDYALVLENLVPVRGNARCVALLDCSGQPGGDGTLPAMANAWSGFALGMRRGDALGLVRFDDAAQVVVPSEGSDVPAILGPHDAREYGAKVIGTPRGGPARLTAGLRALTTLERTPRVLLSGGALADATAAMSGYAKGGQPLHVVALWPTSAETTLAAIAARGLGRYLYGPTEARLGAALAELRAVLTGDPTVRSRTVLVGGSTPQTTVAIPVEDGVDSLQITLTWGTGPELQGGADDPDVPSYALRTPDGHLLPPDSSAVFTTSGPGTAHLELGNVRPGRWVVELTLRRQQPLAVHIAASVPSGPRLLVKPWPAKPVAGDPLTFIARWRGITPDANDVNVTGVVERPFFARALNAAHQKAIRAEKARKPWDRVLAARRRVLAAEGVDLFEPLTEPLEFRYMAAPPDKGGPAWVAVLPVADLPLTWSAQVAGWAMGEGGRRFVRAARASVVVRGRVGAIRVVEPDAAPAGAAQGPWFRPGEEIDIDASGFTGRKAWYGATGRLTSATGGAAHYRAYTPGSTTAAVGDVVALGGAGSAFPLVLTNPATGGADPTVITPATAAAPGGGYQVGKETWAWPAQAPWPTSFDLRVGGWDPPATTGLAISVHACDAFPATGGPSTPTRPAGAAADVRLYRVQTTTGTGLSTIAYVSRTPTEVVWYAADSALVTKRIGGADRRVLSFPTSGFWRFVDVPSLDPVDANRVWVALKT